VPVLAELTDEFRADESRCSGDQDPLGASDSHSQARLASRVILMPARAWETGQLSFASVA
jgi:hypothetical protein